MDVSLINIYIPFKDNKDETKQSLFLGRLKADSDRIEKRIEALRADAEVLAGDIKIGVVCRSDNGTPTYYWRYKSKTKNRKFHRLSNKDLFEYLCSFTTERMDTLIRIEEEIIYCNANLKILYKYRSEISKTNSELNKLNELDEKHYFYRRNLFASFRKI